MTVASYRKPLETYVCFRLDSKTYRMIRELAKSEKISASEILRRACRDYLSRQHDRTGDILLDPASFFQKLARIEKILTQLGIDLKTSTDAWAAKLGIDANHLRQVLHIHDQLSESKRIHEQERRRTFAKLDRENRILILSKKLRLRVKTPPSRPRRFAAKKRSIDNLGMMNWCFQHYVQVGPGRGPTG